MQAARERERDDRRAAPRADQPAGDRPLDDDGHPEQTAKPAPAADGEAPAPVTNVDAALRLALDHLDTHRRADGTLADRHQVNIHLGLDDLLDPTSPTARARIHGTGAIDPRLAAKHACTDAIALIVERDGHPVTVVNPSRHPNRAQRRAVIARDRTCQIPGCARTRGCQVHHIIPAELFGPTALWNLIYLCEHHHTRVHLGDFTIVARPDQAPVIYDREGRPVAGQSDRPPATPPDELSLPALDERATPPHEPMSAFAADNVLHAWHWRSPN